MLLCNLNFNKFFHDKRDQNEEICGDRARHSVNKYNNMYTMNKKKNNFKCTY